MAKFQTAPREGPSSHRASGAVVGETVFRYIVQVKQREKSELKPQHQSRDRGKTRNTDILSLSFANVNFALKEYKIHVRRVSFIIASPPVCDRTC